MEIATAIIWIIPVAGLAAVAFAGWLARDVLSRDTGRTAMPDDTKSLYRLGGGRIILSGLLFLLRGVLELVAGRRRS